MLRLISFVAIVAVAGCGKNDGAVGGPNSCGAVDPCGGDVVGTWKLTTGCLTAAGQKELDDTVTCPAGGSLTITDVNAYGTLTFNTDGTYAVDGVGQQAMGRIVIPVSCATGGSCETAEAALQSSGQFESPSCSGSSTCTCTFSSPMNVTTETGVFSIDGNILTVDGEGGYFCVEGNRLHLLSASDDGAPISSDAVAIRQ